MDTKHATGSIGGRGVMDVYVEYAVAIAIILMAFYLRYVAGLRSGWELLIFWAFWIVGLLLLRDARKRKRGKSN
jgi:hypothetical protein